MTAAEMKLVDAGVAFIQAEPPVLPADVSARVGKLRNVRMASAALSLVIDEWEGHPSSLIMSMAWLEQRDEEIVDDE